MRLTKSYVLDVWQDSEYTSEQCENKKIIKWIKKLWKHILANFAANICDGAVTHYICWL